MALAFDRSPMFAIDKPAGEACPHLDSRGGCTIHDDRGDRGFPGCIQFDCLGAGQRVTQQVFAGRSWRADRSLIGPMSQAFSILLRAHDTLSLLAGAEQLDLSPGDRRILDALRIAIEEAGADAEAIAALQGQARDFLSSLRLYVEGKANGPASRTTPAGVSCGVVPTG